jgi:hypothetical protein
MASLIESDPRNNLEVKVYALPQKSHPSFLHMLLVVLVTIVGGGAHAYQDMIASGHLGY